MSFNSTNTTASQPANAPASPRQHGQPPHSVLTAQAQQKMAPDAVSVYEGRQQPRIRLVDTKWVWVLQARLTVRENQWSKCKYIDSVRGREGVMGWEIDKQLPSQRKRGSEDGGGRKWWESARFYIRGGRRQYIAFSVLNQNLSWL